MLGLRSICRLNCVECTLQVNIRRAFRYKKHCLIATGLLAAPPEVQCTLQGSLGTSHWLCCPLRSQLLVAHSSAQAGICKLRWALASNAGSMHTVSSGKAYIQNLDYCCCQLKWPAHSLTAGLRCCLSSTHPMVCQTTISTSKDCVKHTAQVQGTCQVAQSSTAANMRQRRKKNVCTAHYFSGDEKCFYFLAGTNVLESKEQQVAWGNS